MGHSNSGHASNTPVGLSDVIFGAIVFIGLYFIAASVAGKDGVGFLKGLLNDQRLFEFLVSGLLFLFVWYVLGEIVIKPYLNAFYLREEKTSGTLVVNQGLVKEIEKLKLEIASELKTARIEGIKKRDERLKEAKSRADEILAAEKRVADSSVESAVQELAKLKDDLYSSIDGEVRVLSEDLYRKLTSFDSRIIH